MPATRRGLRRSLVSKETLTAAAVLDSVITVARTRPSEARLDGALLDQLTVVRPLLAAADLGLAAYHPDRHYVLAGDVDGIAVTLTGIVARWVIWECALTSSEWTALACPLRRSGTRRIDVGDAVRH
jgi:hypothetical protein